MTEMEKPHINPDFLSDAGFGKSEIERYGVGLMHSAKLYLVIFQRMHEKGLGEDFWNQFRIYAGTMMTWAKMAEDQVFGHPDDVVNLLKRGTIGGFNGLDNSLGEIAVDGRTHASLLGEWSCLAADMSRAGLGGNYVNFLDICAQTAVGYPAYRWRVPYGVIKKAQECS